MQIVVVSPGAQVALSGRLVTAAAPDVRRVLCEQLETGVDVLSLDLSKVEAVDASGLGVLVGVHRRALRLDRRLVLHAVPTRIDRLIQATKLHRILIIERLVAA